MCFLSHCRLVLPELHQMMVRAPAPIDAKYRAIASAALSVNMTNERRRSPASTSRSISRASSSTRIQRSAVVDGTPEARHSDEIENSPPFHPRGGQVEQHIPGRIGEQAARQELSARLPVADDPAQRACIGQAGACSERHFHHLTGLGSALQLLDINRCRTPPVLRPTLPPATHLPVIHMQLRNPAPQRAGNIPLNTSNME